MTWNERFMPYPILTPRNDDYRNACFELLTPAPVRNGRQISIPFTLKVSSDTLTGLVKDAKAQYVIQTSCVKTLTRNTYATNYEEDMLVLPDGDYADTLILTPYILAMDAISGFKSDEHAVEWRIYHPDGFDIDEAGILAVGDDIEIALAPDSIRSVIDLVALPQSHRMFSVELDNEHIIISVNKEDKLRIDALRQKSESEVTHAALFSGLYLHALTSAIQSLSEYEDRKWAQTIIKQLEDIGVETDKKTIESQSLHYAQMLMEQPLAKYLDAAFMPNEGN